MHKAQYGHPSSHLQESTPSYKFFPNSTAALKYCTWLQFWQMITLLTELNSGHPVRNPTHLHLLVFTSWCDFIMKNDLSVSL